MQFGHDPAQIELRNGEGIGCLFHLSRQWLDQQAFADVQGFAGQLESGIADNTRAFFEII
jgi:hypothetical protein